MAMVVLRKARWAYPVSKARPKARCKALGVSMAMVVPNKDPVHLMALPHPVNLTTKACLCYSMPMAME